MGVVHVPLKSLMDESLYDDWYPLVPQKKEKVSGDLHLRMQFTSALVCPSECF
jgi:hypothetical protein